MTTPLASKVPMVCFIILSVTLLVGGMGMLGAAIILFLHFPAGSPIYLVPLLALNGLLGLLMAALCGASAWKLAAQKPAASAFARLVWGLMAGFIVWMLLGEWLSGWSTGTTVELFIWGLLEAAIARHLFKARRAGDC